MGILLNLVVVSLSFLYCPCTSAALTTKMTSWNHKIDLTLSSLDKKVPEKSVTMRLASHCYEDDDDMAKMTTSCLSLSPTHPPTRRLWDGRADWRRGQAGAHSGILCGEARHAGEGGECCACHPEQQRLRGGDAGSSEVGACWAQEQTPLESLLYWLSLTVIELLMTSGWCGGEGVWFPDGTILGSYPKVYNLPVGILEKNGLSSKRLLPLGWSIYI